MGGGDDDNHAGVFHVSWVLGTGRARRRSNVVAEERARGWEAGARLQSACSLERRRW